MLVDDELGARKRGQVADVVVVEMSDDDLRDRLRRNAEPLESLDRRAQARPPATRADCGVESGVDEHRPLPIAQDVEEVVHHERGVGLAVGLVVVVAVALPRRARSVADGDDVPRRSVVAERGVGVG